MWHTNKSNYTWTKLWSIATFSLYCTYLGCPLGTHLVGEVGWDCSAWSGRKPNLLHMWVPQSGECHTGTSISMHYLTFLFFQPRSDIWIKFCIRVTIIYHNQTEGTVVLLNQLYLFLSTKIFLGSVNYTRFILTFLVLY